MLTRWRRRLAGGLIAVLAAVAGANAMEPMEAYRRADTLFRQGEPGDAHRLLIAASCAPAPLSGEVGAEEYEMLERLARAGALHAIESARQGDRSAAIQAATAGMALSRQLMERPSAGCRDVRHGVTLWLIASEGLETAWRELDHPDRARDTREDLDMMDRFARSVILPRCDSPAVRIDDRADSAEARALARLWAYRLIRVAADNIS